MSVLASPRPPSPLPLLLWMILSVPRNTSWIVFTRLFPWRFVPPILAPPPIIQGCFRDFPIYYGHTPVTSHAVAAQSVLAVFPPHSPLVRTLHKFQSLVSRPPNCYIQFKLCACGSVHGYLTSLTDLDAATPLYVGDPPVDHLDFVIQFDGGAFREHRVGGSGIPFLWLRDTLHITAHLVSSLRVITVPLLTS